MKVKHFEFTSEGYLKAKKYLKKVGEWKQVSTHGFSTDGWSIIATANVILDNKMKEAVNNS